MDERPFGIMIENCNCVDVDGTDDKMCQLNHDDEHTSCKPSANATCKEAVASWANAYQTAENAHDPECFDKDPNYKISQEAHRICTNGGKFSLYKYHPTLQNI